MEIEAATFMVEGVEVSRAILGCDPFILWLHEDDDSPFSARAKRFRRPDGNLDSSRVLEVMRTCLNYGVRSIDLPPPLIEVFERLQEETDKRIEGLGALQEWTCKHFTLDGIPLEEYSEELKATIRPKLPSGYIEELMRSKIPGAGFLKSFFVQKHSVPPLTRTQIESIELEPEHFIEQLEFYKRLDVRLVQFGGGSADWLATIGRTDLLESLNHLITSRGFTALLICHWASMVLPICEEELEVPAYIIPLNKLWSWLTLSETLSIIKTLDKPVIAMKPLARGALAHDIEDAFTFIFKEAGASGVMVGVSSVIEAKRTFSIVQRVLGG